MNVSGYEIDMEKVAHKIALKYASYKLVNHDPPCQEEIEKMLQDYINAYLAVIKTSDEELESLVRW